MARGLTASLAIEDPAQRWARLCREVLRPGHAAPVHEAVFRANYRDWDRSQGPPPAWIPQDDATSRTNLGSLLSELGILDQDQFTRWANQDRGAFWGLMADRLPILFEHRGSRALDLSRGPERPRWFPGSRLNVSASCFQADPGALALIEHSEGGDVRRLTMRELDRLSNRVALGLVALGLEPGEAVGLMTPMTVESVAATLGIHKAGCVVVGVAESFAPAEVALRLAIAGARWVVTSDLTVRRGTRIPIYEKFAEIPGVTAIVISQGTDSPRLRPGDLHWEDFLPVADRFTTVGRDPDDSTTILFSSGTTGEPKAIPWTQTTPIKAAADGFLYHDLRRGDVVAWPSSPGWMMGPWLIYATLINRGAIAVYDGHPGTEGFCRFVEDAGVTVLGLVPSLVSAWRLGGWPSRCDWSRIRLFSSTGECSHPADMLDLMARAGYKPIIEYCGGTEIGGGYLTSTLLRPNAPSCFNTVAFGVELSIRDEDGRPSDTGEGFLMGPSVGLSTELLNRDHHETYFEGTPPGDEGVALRRHGDRIERLPGGFFRVLGRVDDTMNLGGIKVSAVEIERVLNRNRSVRESAAVSVPGQGGGPDRLVVHVVAEGGSPDSATLRKELQAEVNSGLNPLFRISEVVIVDALPRTASNKVMRRSLRPDASAKREP
ncbi:MAG: AMP-binding protein [Isosphaeraceae bacterium]